MAHTVWMLRSGHKFEADRGETILAAGLRQGLALPFGCQSGSCASCRVRLAEGHIEYAAADSPRPAALSEAEAAAGYVLMCRAQPRSDLTLDLRQPEGFEALRPRQWPARVAGHRALSHDVIELRVKLPQPLRFLPGQYVDFLLPDGPQSFESGLRHSRQTLQKRRSFSIAKADAADSILEFHLRVTPGGKFAHYVRDEMPERTLLRLEGPLGAFYLREDSTRPAILMAGGTGFAPLKAMLEHAFAAGLARPFHLFWGARAAHDIYLPELPERWAAAHERFSYTPVLSEPETDWSGERGFVHEAVLRRYPDLAAHEIYMAGPPAMVHAAKRAFATAGLDADHLFYDSFDYAFETWPGLE